MTEKEKITAHISDLKEKCATESIVLSSNFLSANEISEIIKIERVNNRYVDTFYYGGYENSERKTVVFVPKFYGVSEDTLQDFLNTNGYNPLQLLNIKKDRFINLTHRDYLGAVMGLGIKREMIGDIIVNENGCSLFCLKAVASFLVENLKQAGRGNLAVDIGNMNELDKIKPETEIAFISVASLRIDCLVAAVFKISRNSAVNAINQGLVYVNSEQITKTDYLIKQGDKLVLRGKGKSAVDEIIGENKKGRIHINIKRYL